MSVFHGIRKFTCQFFTLTWFYFSFASNEVLKRKKSYVFGLAILIIAVSAIVVLISIVSQVTLVLFRFSELYNEECDIVVSSNDASVLLNYTRIRELTPMIASSPRFEIQGVNAFDACSLYSNLTKMEAVDLIYKRVEKCNLAARYCFPADCFSFLRTTLVVFDTDLERKMGFGRSWAYPAIENGTAYVTRSFASYFNLSINSTFTIEVNMWGLQSLLEGMGVFSGDNFQAENTVVYIPIRVGKIITADEHVGKSVMLNPVMMEFRYFAGSIAQYIHPKLRHSVKLVTTTDYAMRAHFNIPDRIEVFRNNRFLPARNKIISFASGIAYVLGYTQITMKFPLIENLEKYMIIETYSSMGVILTIILIDFTSVILIHSLFMVNIESKSFDNGILRSLGLKRYKMFLIVGYEFLMYAIPGIVVGFSLGFVIYMICSHFLTLQFKIPFARTISIEAFGWSVLSGVVVSALSSIFPIVRLGKETIMDSLDSVHRTVSDVKYTVERATDTNRDLAKYLFVGSGLTLFGILSCYVYPLALFHNNVELLSLIYLTTVMMIIAGFVWLSFLFENPLQSFLIYVLFRCSSEAMRDLMRKNLKSHKMRNRRSVLLYSLCIGMVIFISVTYSLQTISFRGVSQQVYGSKFAILSTATPIDTQSFHLDLDGLVKHSPEISGFTFMSVSLDGLVKSKVQLSNIGRIRFYDTVVSAVPPNFYHVLNPEYLILSSMMSKVLSPSRGIYQKIGANGAIIGDMIQKRLYLTHQDRFLINVGTKRHQFRPVAVITNSPASLTFNIENGVDTLVSFPKFLELTNGTVKDIAEIPISKFFLQFHMNTTGETKLLFHRKLISLVGTKSIQIIDSDLALETIEGITTIFDTIAMIIVFFIMIICGFAFLSNMYLNIQDQAKEIGILMALGTKKWFIQRLFVYESFILILSSCMIGLAIGALVAYLITLQRSLFESIYLPYLFPWKIILIIIPLGLISSLLTLIPSCLMTSRRIIKNLYER